MVGGTAFVIPARLFRTGAFRLAVTYALLFAVVAVAVSGIAYVAVTRYADQQVDLSLQSEVQAVTAALAGKDRAAVLADIQARIADTAPDYFYYGLQDPGGAVLVGNLPRPVAETVGPNQLLLDEKDGYEPGEPHLIRGTGVALPDGLYLFIGRDTYDLGELQEVIGRSFAAAAVALLVLALVGGVIVGSNFIARVETVNNAARRIMRGNLGERIPSAGTDDEFDRLAHNLNAMLDRNQLLMEGLRQVSNDIAHDLRTPLSHMRQRLELARLQARTVGELQEALDRAIVDIDDVLGLFRALLRIAQIEAGVRSEGFSRVDLSGLVATVVEAYGTVAEESGHGLAADIAPGIAWCGDRQLLTQMVANLVENALRHTPPGTAVAVGLRRGPDGAVVTTIADTGPGIPAELREKVFRRFYRLDSSRNTPGSGLGLSLVAAVAQLHGLTIDLADHAPGLRVTVSFPPAAAAEAGSEPAPAT
ncbi:HAMP domain-containing sensor histidine kinase [Inquilinus sp.]|uniref:sensor histidine kinase n=1 Tax=Inquilinus sp. TaxID=1932117 RepID=UPI0031DEC566